MTRLEQRVRLAGLRREFHLVDKALTAATDPRYTVISEHGVQLLRDKLADLVREIDLVSRAPIEYQPKE